MSNTFTFDALTELLRCEFGYCDLAHSHRRRGEHDRKVDDVIHGRGVQMHVALRVRHPILEMQDVRKDAVVCDDGSLGLAGSPTRVEEC